MFTGIIHHCGKIEEIRPNKGSIALVISSLFTDLVLGESIAVDGACLTVIEIKDSHFVCEVSPETLKLTISRSYEAGTSVHLERSLRLTDRIGGHFVMGHVDSCYRVESITPHSQCHEVKFVSDLLNPPYLIKKGSIAVNGVSLTINEVTKKGFSVMLIPYTMENSTLSCLAVGRYVNIEYDYLAKIVINHIVNDYERISSSNH